MKGILFIDIDGVLLSGSHFILNNDYDLEQFHFSRKEFAEKIDFDKTAIQFINRLCFLGNIKLVIHSSWRITMGSEFTYQKMVEEGIKPEYFHDDYACPIMGMSSEKADDINGWLRKHNITYYDENSFDISENKQIVPYFVIDDKWIYDRDILLKTDYMDGFTFKDYSLLCGYFSIRDDKFGIFPIEHKHAKKIKKRYGSLRSAMNFIYYHNEPFSHLLSDEGHKIAFQEHKNAAKKFNYQSRKYDEFVRIRENTAYDKLSKYFYKS